MDLAKPLSSTASHIAGSTTALRKMLEEQVHHDEVFTLSRWVQQARQVSPRLKKLARDYIDLSTYDHSSIICYELSKQATHYALYINSLGLVIDFGPSYAARTNGCISIDHKSKRYETKWYLPPESYSRSLEVRPTQMMVDLISLFERWGEGIFPTDIPYDLVTCNCQHFTSMVISNEYYSPEIDGTYGFWRGLLFD